MVKIVIENLAQKELEVSDASYSILKIIHTHFIDWMHACGGKGRCTTCKMIVLEGMENLSPITSVEQRYRKNGQLAENERLSCQASAAAFCRIRVPDECKFPHMTYSS